jgi:hypothetical protein
LRNLQWGRGTFSSPDAAVSTGHCYRYSFTVADRVGNVSSAATATAKVDTAAPTVSINAPSALTGAGNQYYDAGTKTLFFRSTGAGSFSLGATASDTDTAVAGVTFPNVSGLTGWAGSTGGTDTSSPYGSPADYTWSSGAAEPGARSVSATDKAANSATDTITITDDTSAPTGQSITLTGATAPFYPGGPVTFSLTNGSDPSGGSGLDLSSAAITRETGTLATNNCSGFSPDGGTFTSPDNSTSSGHCYRYTFSIADKVGNVATSSVTAKVSSNAPTVSVEPPTVLTGGNQYYDAGTRPVLPPRWVGSFSLNATADDADAGVTHVAFPDVSGVSGWSGSTGGNDTTSPYASPADYTWTSGATAPGARSIVATNSVALTNSDTITLAADSAGPTAQSVTLTGATAPYYGSASVSFTLADGNDGAGSGLDVSTRTVTRETGTLSGNSCTSFSPDAGTFTSPDTAVSAGHCYRYSFTIADKVGNISSAATATAKVDNGAPTVSVGTPTALTGAGNQYYDAGTKTVFFRSTGSGSFDLNATASDSDTAVDAVDFPTISSLSGWSGSTGGADTTSPYSSPTHYSWSSGAAEPGVRTVSATDKAANSASDTITIADDTSAPTGQSITLTGACPYCGSNSVGFSLANGSDNGGGAGLDLASATVTRETGTLSGDSCSGFSADAGTFTSPRHLGVNGHCYATRSGSPTRSPTSRAGNRHGQGRHGQPRRSR